MTSPATDPTPARAAGAALRVDEGLSTSGILGATVAAVRKLAPGARGRHLDIGAGHGQLIDRMQAGFEVKSEACDYTTELMRTPGVRVSVADLNTQPLPYTSDSFEVVTCTEVVEHLESHRHLIREAFRVLKSGGVFVLTTPNVLNLKSRIRYLLFGFFDLFGPLHLRDSRRFSTGGHIGPVSAFYLAHALAEAGFSGIDLTVDKRQRSSLAWLALFGLPIWIGSRLARRRERRRFDTLDEHNEPFVRRMNEMDVLCGRTIVIGCRKA